MANRISYPGEALYEDFGSGMANLDAARGGNDIAFFVETASARRFLRSLKPFVVGAKGAGKSLLLFRRMLEARTLSGALVLPSRGSQPYVPAQALGDLVSFSQYYQLWGADGRPLLGRWSALWEWSLLRSILVGWARYATEHSNASQLSALKRLDESLLDAEHDDPFAFMRGQLETIDEGHTLKKGLLRLPLLDSMRSFVKNRAHDFPPLFMFLDNLDDYFEKDSNFWIASCLGAFLAIHQIHLQTESRVHLFLTLRPEVVWELQKDQNYPKWSLEIVRLEWDSGSLIELFKRRIRKIQPGLLRSPAYLDRDPIVALLGEDLVRDPAAGPQLRDKRTDRGPEEPTYESAMQYILRNTLLRPRDLIIVGNTILRKTQEPLPAGDTQERRVRDAIDEARATIAGGYVAEIAPLWPWPASGTTSLQHFLSHFLPSNVLARKDVEALEQDFLQKAGPNKVDKRPFSVLAALGLIGYTVQGSEGLVQRFARVSETTLPMLPKAEWYLVNPILCGEPYHVPIARGIVVGPDLPFDGHVAAISTAAAAAGSTSSLPPSVSQVHPASVPSPPERTAFRWVHLSDLHFGAGNASFRVDHEQVMDAIARDVEKHARVPPDRIFVTGDIAFSARKEQYARALKWLRRIAEAARVSIEQVQMVPGNHDISRHKTIEPVPRALHEHTRTNPEHLDEVLRKDARPLRQKLANYVKFARGVSQSAQHAPWGIDWCERLHLPNAGTIHVIGLCTVWTSDAFDGRQPEGDSFFPNMVVGQAQIQSLIDDTSDEDLFILLTHHPVEWFHPWSAQKFKIALGRRKVVHLCGHLHVPQAHAGRRLAANGQMIRAVASAAHDDPEGAGQHGYAWGELRHRAGAWEVGWAPRVYDAEANAMASSAVANLDLRGFAWERLDLGWQAPGVEGPAVEDGSARVAG
jgi:predicted MPP superfamily phosphohydrolase